MAMTKTHLATTVLLLAAVWASAQTPSSSNSQSQQSTAQTVTPAFGYENETIEGCLSGSDGVFTLTDSATGKVYALTGDVSALGDHVGQEVRLTGAIGEAAASSPGAAVGTGDSGTTSSFTVRKARTIANTCKSYR